jgi:hypothetical protein
MPLEMVDPNNLVLLWSSIINEPVYVVARHDEYLEGKSDEDKAVLKLLKQVCEETRATEFRFKDPLWLAI